MIEKKCVFFDLGGVLYHLDVEAVLKGLGECSSSSTAEIKDVLYSPELYEKYESGAISSVLFYETVKDLTGCDISFKGFKSVWNSLLVKREDMFRLALNTGKSVDLLALSNTNEINAEVLRTDLKGLIKDAVYSFEVGFMKPDHRIFKIALDRVKLSPENVLFIDDSEENVNAALQLGIDAHLFKSADGVADFLRLYGIKANDH
jgi:FMN phosphatase YigB (HAD superfamily)